MSTKRKHTHDNVLPTVALSDNWESELGYDDFMFLKNWNKSRLNKKQKYITLSNYHITVIQKIEESQMIVGSFHDIVRAFSYFGLMAISSHSNIYRRGAISILSKAKSSWSLNREYEIILSELISKINANDKSARKFVQTVFELYGDNHIARYIYKKFFNEEYIVEQVKGCTIKTHITDICEDVIEEQPTTSLLSIGKATDNESVRINIHGEVITLIKEIQDHSFKGYLAAQILRAAVVQGLYMWSKLVLDGKYNYMEKDIMMICFNLEKYLTEND